jgi:GMP synthase (glutamine-hydrolysing)
MHPDQDDHFHWLGSEAEFLVETLRRGVPVLGVCLGAQMLARAAGAWVGPAQGSEVGWFQVTLTPEGRDDPVLGTLPERTKAFQWHHYTYAVPEGGTELARSELCTQAFRLDERAWGIQFHAEVTLPMLAAWAEEDAAELPVSPEEFIAESATRIEAWNEQGRRLCAAFLEQAANGG